MEPQTINPSSQPAQVTSPPAAPQPSNPIPSLSTKRGNKLPVILLVLVLLAAGALGYLYYKSNNDLKKKSQELSSAYQTVENFQAIIDEQEAADDFIAQENDAELSRALCGGKPVAMFDVHLNDQFAVFRYLCSNQNWASPIRIAALKKLPDGSYEFTYGASTSTPNNLPDYIYNSEPEFFGGPYGAILY